MTAQLGDWPFAKTIGTRTMAARRRRPKTIMPGERESTEILINK